MKIIGAGFGRSGTMSLKSALERLGCGPCYHMKINPVQVRSYAVFMRAWSGKKVNWKRFFRRYNSVVDWPACSFYKDLMKEFPDARVLLNIREPEAWYDSMKETIFAIQPAFHSGSLKVVRKMHDEIIWKGSLKGVFEDRQKLLLFTGKYIEDVTENRSGRQVTGL